MVVISFVGEGKSLVVFYACEMQKLFPLMLLSCSFPRDMWIHFFHFKALTESWHFGYSSWRDRDGNGLG